MTCSRCGARLLEDRDLSGERELYCINGHRRGLMPLTATEEAGLRLEASAPSFGKHFKRIPTTNGIRLD